MNRIEEKSNALDIIYDILDYSFEQGISYAKEMGSKPEKIMVSIISENLDTEVGVVIHKINKDAVKSLANRLDDVATSYDLMGRNNLYGAPFIVDLTVISLKDLKK